MTASRSRRRTSNAPGTCSAASRARSFVPTRARAGSATFWKSRPTAMTRSHSIWVGRSQRCSRFWHPPGRRYDRLLKKQNPLENRNNFRSSEEFRTAKLRRGSPDVCPGQVCGRESGFLHRRVQGPPAHRTAVSLLREATALCPTDHELDRAAFSRSRCRQVSRPRSGHALSRSRTQRHFLIQIVPREPTNAPARRPPGSAACLFAGSGAPQPAAATPRRPDGLPHGCGRAHPDPCTPRCGRTC